MSTANLIATPEATDKLTYWQQRLASATDRFERKRAEDMVLAIERQAARDRGEKVETVKRKNFYAWGFRRAGR